MIKVKIVGETHSSSKDVKRLEAMIKSENYDAFFIEGRENNLFEKNTKPSLSYIFFLLGWAEWLLVQKLHASKERVYEFVKERNIPIYHSIDASFPEIFKMGNIFLRRFLFPILFFISSWAIFFDSPRILGYLLILFSPLLSFCVIVLTANEKRDSYIANSIISTINSNKLSNVLVSCGSLHVSGIANNLKRAGIEVEAA